MTVHRLRCGKGMTGTTLHQLKARPNNLCSMCGVPEDVIHILDHCQKYEVQREAWKRLVKDKVGEDDLRSCMNCDLWMLLLFVSECDIVV